MAQYRNLNDKEIATLTVYGCSAENWNNVTVAEGFSPSYISNVHFSGTVSLGTYDKVVELEGGLKKHTGIFNCCLHNCVVGKDVYINKVNNYIANFTIGNSSYIENVNLIAVDGLSSFGNGLQVPVMNESGGRKIPIFDYLSAPLAYMLTFYNYHSELFKHLKNKINEYSNLQQSNTGVIGENVRIVNCGSIKNVRIGDYTTIDGTSSLEKGTIISNENAPVYIGADVQCKNFIINSGSNIYESAIIENCFVGQSCIIGKQFSALDSVFFANCQALHGEAVSIFAGPYTVTHHKSTLMLTALYSFMNAGSGSNFSNHMYKLGPIHQGITERGVKTSSNSYIMWPAHIGPFTVVSGSQKGNPNLSDMPFSYLLENNGESALLPGVNLHSAGTIRDVIKWKERDNRTDNNKIDPINFNFLSPYTLSKALRGIEILTQLLKSIDEGASFVWYENCKIKRSSIKKGIELYELAISQFVGDSLLTKLKGVDFQTKDELLNVLIDESNVGVGDWVDMAGLYLPKTELSKLQQEIETDNISLIEIQERLTDLHAKYDSFSWNWTKNLLERKFGKSLSEFEIEDFVLIVIKWKESIVKFNDLILRDAKKEFNSVSKIGYGIDGSQLDKDIDFENIRGKFDAHFFVKYILGKTNETIELEKVFVQKFVECN